MAFEGHPPAAALREAMAAGVPSYDAVIAEHAPLMPGGGSCRSWGFVYTNRPVCPAAILARAGYPVLADRVRVNLIGARIGSLRRCTRVGGRG